MRRFQSLSGLSHNSMLARRLLDMFLGAGSVSMLRHCIREGIVEARPDAKLVPRSYYGIWAAIHRVGRRIGLDPKIQTCHGLRKYFENALDDANIDHGKKMIIEGHFAGTRAQHYTDRYRTATRSLQEFVSLHRSGTNLYPTKGMRKANCSTDWFTSRRLTRVANSQKPPNERHRLELLPTPSGAWRLSFFCLRFGTLAVNHR